MFNIPGFNVGNLVVEAPNEQLRKRKHGAIATIATTTTTTTSTVATPTTTSASTSNPASATRSTTYAGSAMKSAPSTSNTPPGNKRFKKDNNKKMRSSTFDSFKSSIAPDQGQEQVQASEPVLLKDRASWNRSTKALRKAKVEEENAKRKEAIADKKKIIHSISGRPAVAVELLLQGEVDLGDITGTSGNTHSDKVSRSGNTKDIEMTDIATTPDMKSDQVKKRNKRLERKIKKAAYIAAIESMKEQKSGDLAMKKEPSESSKTKGQSEGGDGDDRKKKQEQEKAGPLHPELVKLSQKEKRLLKEFQEKQREQGIDLVAVASDKLLKAKNKAATAAAAIATNVKAMKQNNNVGAIKGKQDKREAKIASNKGNDEKQNTKKVARAAITKETKVNQKSDSEISKKQQQLAKEREKLLEALNRTNNALAELQDSLGDGEDETPMKKKDVKLAVLGNKGEKKDKATVVTKAISNPQVSATSSASAKQPKLTKLQEQMKKTLAGGKFRFLNEQLYTTTGEEAFTLFQSKPELFDEYHEGFRAQVESWPQNPVDIFIADLQKMPKDTVIADLGCGDAQISKELERTKHKNVLSFDLVAKNDHVTACDIAHLPLEDTTVDVAIFCLSLMGTDFLKFLKEAYRVLKPNGQLRIAEVISRFTDVDAFVAALKALGFELKHLDSSNKMFIMLDFIKPGPESAGNGAKKGKKGNKKQNKREELSEVGLEVLDGPSLLKPCIYKKR